MCCENMAKARLGNELMTLTKSDIADHLNATIKDGDASALAKRCVKASEEPQQPFGHVDIAFLGAFQNILIAFTALLDRSRHRIKATGLALGSRQCQISNCARYAAIAIFKRVDGDEPKMRERGAKHRIKWCIAINTGQKSCHFNRQA